MAPSEEMVGQRLLLWARRDGGRLARVEYASEFDRERLLQWLKAEGIELVDIDLPAGETAVAAVDFLLRRLAEVSERVTAGELTAGGVVSVSGFARAFQSQASLADSLRTLNFNREALTAFPLRQIWWMTPVLLETSLHAMPDMHGWFNPQLALTRVTTSGAGRMPVATAMRAEREPLAQSNIEDARQRSGHLLEELEAARESGAAELGLMMTYLVPALEAVAAVGARQELKVLMTRYKDLLSRFYSMTNTEVLTALKREEAVSTDALSLARSLSRLVKVFYQQGLYTEAERMCVRALEIRKAELGDRHPDTALSLNNLAALYDSQGRYGEAEPLFIEALDISKAELGDRHPDTALSLNNLAELYRSQGRYGEAEPLYLEALDIRKAELGDRHPDTAQSLNNLAALYDSQGRYGEAEPLFIEAIDISKAELSDRHPDTATSLNNLAGLYGSQGRYGKAEPLFIEALDIRKAELGDRHPDTASSLLNLAALYHNTQQHQRALKLIQQALDIYVPVLGADHPSTQNAIGWRETIQQPLQPTHSPKAISHWLRRAWQAIRGSN